MEKATYTSREEAIEREIIQVIENGEAKADEFDIEAIADVVLADYEDGFTLKVDESAFWESVFANIK